MKGDGGHYNLMQQNIQMGLHEQGRRLDRLEVLQKSKVPQKNTKYIPLM